MGEKDSGPEGNRRLTALVGALLLALFAAQGVTILFLGRLLTWHFVIGLALIGPVALKVGVTGYRFVRYYAGSPAYRREGPPATPLRLLAPLVVLLTVAVLATGCTLALGGRDALGLPVLFLHKAFFWCWAAVTGVHVLAYVWRLPRLIGADLPRRRAARRAAAPGHRDDRNEMSAAETGPLRVLVVEDDPVIADSLVRGLRQAGYRAESVDTGRAALTAAVAERRAAGLDSVPVRVEAAPHGYVTSASSALVQWLDGGPARPTTAPPRTHEKGVRGRPTLVQNVETLAHLALVARHGAEWFRRAGTAASPGTVLITVTGAVRRPAVLETDPGTPLGTLLRQAGGAERPLQAVLVGGFAGTWLPLPHALRRPFDREGLAPHAAPGAGVVAALPQDACPLAETARILAYLAANGAQQCGPCRFGLPAVAEDAAALADGRATPELLDRLRHRVGLLPGRGACGHPDGAARLAASALTVFRTDVEHHLHHGSCHRTTALAVPPPTPTEDWR